MNRRLCPIRLRPVGSTRICDAKGLPGGGLLCLGRSVLVGLSRSTSSILPLVGNPRSISMVSFGILQE